MRYENEYNNVISFDARAAWLSKSVGRTIPPTPDVTTAHGGSGERLCATNLTMDTEAEVLFEQLTYLIRFADQERERLDRVKSILFEAFN